LYRPVAREYTIHDDLDRHGLPCLAASTDLIRYVCNASGAVALIASISCRDLFFEPTGQTDGRFVVRN
jgi:hypothetical protein